MTTGVRNYLQELPLKKLAKDYAFYEMKEGMFAIYVKDLKEVINSKLPTFADKTEEFQNYIEKLTAETIQESIAGYIKNSLQLKLDEELKKCRSDSKKEIIDKTLNFIWKYYLEVPIAYKNRLNQKILPKPVLDSVNYSIFHFELEKLFKEELDFNSIVNSNYNEITDYLLDHPLSLKHLQI